MQYLTHIPSPPLNEFIEHFWCYEGYAPLHSREKRLPDGATEMVINLREEGKYLFEDETSEQGKLFKKSWISGQQQGALVIDVSGQSSMMGVRFRAGGAHPFFPFPMGEITDKVVELDLIWGREAHFLQEKLVEAPLPAAKFQLLEHFLLDRCCRDLAWNPYIEFSVKALQQPAATPSIQHLTERTGISHKHLLRTFERHIGIRPKMLARIFKFQQALRLLEAKESLRWTDLAYDCGYYDQAHFIKEFQGFAGLNPTSYFDQRGEYVNYIPL